MSPEDAAAESPELFGGVHLGVLGLSLLLTVLVIWVGRRLRGTEAGDLISRGAGWILLAVSLGWMVWGLLPGNWILGDSLPLHYSDILRYITAVALITRSRWAVAITYYWGLTLNTQAMITPHPSQLEIFSMNFLFYWGLHIAVLLAPVWLIWGLGHRPGWKEYGVALTAALLWAAIVMMANSALGTNYAFLNRHPEGASLLDYMGPWPVYVVWLVILAAALWALMTWPWVRRAKPEAAAPDKLVT